MRDADQDDDQKTEHNNTADAKYYVEDSVMLWMHFGFSNGSGGVWDLEASAKRTSCSWWLAAYGSIACESGIQDLEG